MVNRQMSDRRGVFKIENLVKGVTGGWTVKGWLPSKTIAPKVNPARSAEALSGVNPMNMRLARVTRLRAVALGAETRCQNGSPTRRPSGLRSARGQSAVEFALVLPVFFLLIFTVMDFGRMFFVQENIQRAVEEGARYASTGIHQSGTNPSTGQPYSRVQSIQDYVQQEASIPINMGASLSSLQVSSVQGGAGSAGGPQDIETITLTTNLPLMTPFVSRFFPNGQYTFTASATVQNEPFPPGQTK